MMKPKPKLLLQANKVFPVLLGLTTVAHAAPSVISDLPGVVEPDTSTATMKSYIPSDTVKALPSRKERASSGQAGPGIVVSAFRLEGANDYPDSGIDTTEMKSLIEAFRAQRMANKGKLTFSDIEQAAEIITNYYRKNGLIVSYAFVPAQDVADGVVTIQVMEGRLGAIKADLAEDSIYTQKQFEALFTEQMGKPIVKEEIEKALLIARDYHPTARISGILTPDGKPGETDLIVRARGDKRINNSVGIDNYGSKYTGRTRVRAGIGINNITGRADRLDINLLKGLGESNLYGGGQYDLPIMGGKTHVGFSYSLNDYKAGADIAALEITGINQTARAYAKHDFFRTRERRLTGSLGINRKDSEIELAGNKYSRDILSVVDLGMNARAIDRLMGNEYIALNLFSFNYHHGFNNLFGSLDRNDSGSSRSDSSGTMNADGNFNKFTAEYYRFQSLGTGMMFTFRVRGQWTTDMLVSIEQEPLGGPNNVRAYPRAEFMRDRGYFTSAEFSTDVPDLGKKLKAFVFMDYGKGWLNDPLRDQEKAISLAAVGVGLKINIDDSLLGRFQVATPLGTRAASNSKDPQAYFDLTWHF
uniref:Hemolysin activation/secretion protein n=1 Tax=Candidatus Kentrum sp. FW TaxID=2126338 RepID=A0A450U0J7_9GAMM|nr:MAG: Hemolysin activation/secretion protein [Candidatus Kentron sp. FW]